MKTWRLITAALLLASTTALSLSATANMGDDEPGPTPNADATAGKKAIEAKDWKRATELLTKAAAADPKNADVQNWLGFAQRKQGNLDAAFSAYDKALKLNPRHKAAHEYIGETYLLVGDVAGGEGERVPRLRPRLARALPGRRPPRFARAHVAAVPRRRRAPGGTRRAPVRENRTRRRRNAHAVPASADPRAPAPADRRTAPARATASRHATVQPTVRPATAAPDSRRTAVVPRAAPAAPPYPPIPLQW